VPLRIHNTLTRQIEPFIPAHPRVVRIYTCGLTTYAPMHAGHARTYCFWDVFRRYLEYRSYHVISVINYTDLDDRIMAKAREGRGCVDVAEAEIAGFRRDCRALHIKDYAAYTRATDFIEEQVDMVAQLLDKGHAYVTGGEVFYEVATFSRYGALSGRDVDEQRVGASERVEEDFARKRHPADFTLWKPSADGQPAWPTGHAAWPSGRPGWHIECSAMSTTVVGHHFDVHGGGIDNLFPHHENEVAQSEPLCGHPWVRYWLHPEHLDLRGEKMSKSLGNVIHVPALCARHGYDAVRWFYATHHYRTKLPFSWELMDQACAGYRRIRRLVDVLAEKLSAAPELPSLGVAGQYASQRPREAGAPRMRHTYTVGIFAAQSERFIERFIAAMDDDLNTPVAIAAFFDYAAELYAGGVEVSADLVSLLSVYRCLTAHLAVLGVELARPELHPELCAEGAVEPQRTAAGRGGDDAIERLVELRGDARKQRDFAKADAIRKLLTEVGIEIEDKPEGTSWRVK
jgi:cysteinyl-tRNA synthetase